MANEFKAAADRKKRLNELRKAEKTIGQIEEFMTERSDVLSVSAAEILRNAADKLSEATKEAYSDVGTIAALNDEAQAVYENALKTLENQPAVEPEEKADDQPKEESAEKKNEAAVVEPAETKQEQTENSQEEVPGEEEVQEETVQEKEEPAGERVADILREMYAAPRYSRVGGETKTRFSALIKPSLRAKMDEDAKAGKIKSPNDLINVLLEIYYGEE